jgi:hypothetical protein
MRGQRAKDADVDLGLAILCAYDEAVADFIGREPNI